MTWRLRLQVSSSRLVENVGLSNKVRLFAGGWILESITSLYSLLHHYGNLSQLPNLKELSYLRLWKGIEKIFFYSVKRGTVLWLEWSFILVVVLFSPLKALLYGCRMISVVFTGRLDIHHWLLQGITKDIFGPKKIALKGIIRYFNN